MRRGLPFLQSTRHILAPDTQAWYAAVRAAGASVSTSTLLAVDRYVRALIQARLWDKIRMIDCCAGSNLVASLVRLKVPAGIARAYTNNNFVDADFVERGTTGGRAGDGSTKYLDTLINPLSLGFSVSDFMFFYYRRATNPASTTRIDMGATSAGAITYSGWVLGGSTEAVYVATTAAASTYGTGSRGFLGGGTAGSRSQQWYGNGQPLGTPGDADGVFPNFNIYAHAVNQSGPATAFSNAKTSHFMITKGLTSAEVLTLYNIVQSFESAMGRAV